jgi:tRNA pseudouridine38-40 synthase
MNRILIKIAFDGLKFSGSAKQPNKRTVQGELEKHLSKLYDEEVKVIIGSRTDAGVHALEFPFTIDVNNNRELYQVKSYLQDHINDIRVNAMQEVPMEFNPKYDATSRRYAYKIYTGNDAKGLHLKNYHLDYKHALDKTLIKTCFKVIKGTHDFASFTAKEKYDNTTRTIKHLELKVNKKENYTSIIVEANGFLR